MVSRRPAGGKHGFGWQWNLAIDMGAMLCSNVIFLSRLRGWLAQLKVNLKKKRDLREMRWQFLRA